MTTGKPNLISDPAVVTGQRRNPIELLTFSQLPPPSSSSPGLLLSSAVVAILHSAMPIAPLFASRFYVRFLIIYEPSSKHSQRVPETFRRTRPTATRRRDGRTSAVCAQPSRPSRSVEKRPAARLAEGISVPRAVSILPSPLSGDSFGFSVVPVRHRVPVPKSSGRAGTATASED